MPFWLRVARLLARNGGVRLPKTGDLGGPLAILLSPEWKAELMQRRSGHTAEADLRFAPEVAFDIRRPRLDSKSPFENKKQLTALTAPTGFGKTLLMAQWSRDAAANGMTPCWHNVSRQANPLQLLLRQVGQLIGVETGPPDAAEPDMGMIVEASTRLNRRYVVFVDNLQKMTEQSQIQDFVGLVEQCHASLRFVISTNIPHHVPLSTLRAQNQLEQINAETLKCSPSEIREFLGDDLSEEAVSFVEAITDGWPVALQYMRLNPRFKSALRGNPLDIDALPQLDDVNEFIQENIFLPMSKALKTVLIDMSAFESFSANQAEFICEMGAVGGLLHREAPFPFLRQSAGDPRRFEFNPIFRRFLGRELDWSSAEHVERVHQRAAQWFENNGDALRAISCALKLKDTQIAVDIFNRAGGIELGFRHGMEKLQEIISRIPPAIAEREPQIALSNAVLHMKDGNLDLGRHFLRTADYQISQVEPTSPFQHYASIPTMLMAIYEDKDISLTEIEQKYDRRENPGTESYWAQGWYNNLACMIYYARGDMGKAERSGTLALELYRAAGSDYSQIFMHIHLGMINHIKGRLFDSETCYTAAKALCMSQSSPDAGLQALADVLLAEVYFEYGDFPTAEEHLSQSLSELDKHEAWVEVLGRGYVTASYLALVRNAVPEANSILDRCETIARSRDLPRLLDIIDVQRMEIAALSGDMEHAKTLLQDSDLIPSMKHAADPEQRHFQNYYRSSLGMARLLLQQSRGRQATKILDTIMARQQQSGHLGFFLRAAVMKVMALSSIDMQQKADQLFLKLAANPKFRLFKSPFVLEGAAMKYYLKELIGRIPLKELEPDVISFIGSLIAALDTPERTTVQIGILSKKENEVLSLLGAGHSNKMIARVLDISEATVKYHLRNIFTKLGVGNRLMAVQVARAKGVLAE